VKGQPITDQRQTATTSLVAGGSGTQPAKPARRRGDARRSGGASGSNAAVIETRPFGTASPRRAEGL
jgi:hypothetical protein